MKSFAARKASRSPADPRDLDLTSPSRQRGEKVAPSWTNKKPNIAGSFGVVYTYDATGEPTFYVMPDVLAIGSNADYFRMPMGPRTAQSIGDAFGCIMPTRKMVNDIYTASTVKVARSAPPCPIVGRKKNTFTGYVP
jgi:hypothetical protein